MRTCWFGNVQLNASQWIAHAEDLVLDSLLIGALMSPEKAICVSGEMKKLGPIERVKRSFGRSVLVLTAGVFCIFIPGMHFILVPGCVIGSFISFWKTYQQLFQLNIVEKINCPHCRHSVQVPSFLREELKFKCPQCAVSCFVKKV